MLPVEASSRRDLILVDIRSPMERATSFLPASLSLTLSAWTPMQRTLDLLETLDGEVKGLVVHCTSGVRSKKLRETFADETSLPVYDLEGGLRAWEAEGLPVCRLDPKKAEPLESLLEYRDLLLRRVSGERATAPCPVLAECFRRARVRWDAPTVEGLYSVLDWVGIAAFHKGEQRCNVAEHLVGMYARLRSLDRRPSC